MVCIIISILPLANKILQVFALLQKPSKPVGPEVTVGQMKYVKYTRDNEASLKRLSTLFKKLFLFLTAVKLCTFNLS